MLVVDYLQTGVDVGGEGGIRTHGTDNRTPDFEHRMRFLHTLENRATAGCCFA